MEAEGSPFAATDGGIAGSAVHRRFEYGRVRWTAPLPVDEAAIASGWPNLR